MMFSCGTGAICTGRYVICPTNLPLSVSPGKKSDRILQELDPESIIWHKWVWMDQAMDQGRCCNVALRSLLHVWGQHHRRCWKYWWLSVHSWVDTAVTVFSVSAVLSKGKHIYPRQLVSNVWSLREGLKVKASCLRGNNSAGHSNTRAPWEITRGLPVGQYQLFNYFLCLVSSASFSYTDVVIKSAITWCLQISISDYFQVTPLKPVTKKEMMPYIKSVAVNLVVVSISSLITHCGW